MSESWSRLELKPRGRARLPPTARRARHSKGHDPLEYWRSCAVRARAHGRTTSSSRAALEATTRPIRTLVDALAPTGAVLSWADVDRLPPDRPRQRQDARSGRRRPGARGVAAGLDPAVAAVLRARRAPMPSPSCASSPSDWSSRRGRWCRRRSRPWSATRPSGDAAWPRPARAATYLRERAAQTATADLPAIRRALDRDAGARPPLPLRRSWRRPATRCESPATLRVPVPLPLAEASCEVVADRLDRGCSSALPRPDDARARRTTAGTGRPACCSTASLATSATT